MISTPPTSGRTWGEVICFSKNALLEWDAFAKAFAANPNRTAAGLSRVLRLARFDRRVDIAAGDRADRLRQNFAIDELVHESGCLAARDAKDTAEHGKHDQPDRAKPPGETDGQCFVCERGHLRFM